jgi:prepilin-type N-terminal cleavage/methylation domain-containing protein
MKTHLNRPFGFTLVEMAIVLVIVGLLLGGMLMPLSAQMEQRRIGETQKALDEINQALIGFAVANGRLPCPAPGNSTTGEESVTGTGVSAKCSAAVGVVPWQTLGVSEADAWGRRFTYRVAGKTHLATDVFVFSRAINPASTDWGISTCSPSPTPTQAAFALCSQGDVSVRDSTGSTPPTCTSVNHRCYPAIIISHGKNGLGAWPSPAGTQLATTGAGTDEVTNATSTTTSFVAHTYASDFDDLVTWLSPNTLFNRMVAAGKLP